MPITSAVTGPLLVFRESPPDAGPSPIDRGVMLLDQRSAFAYPGQTPRGWLNSEYLASDQAPATLANNNIVTAGTGSGAGSQTLAGASTGITINQTVVNSLTGVTDTGLIAIDTAMTPLAIGPVGVWDPLKILGRAVSVQSGSNNAAVVFTIRGYDVYGFPMTETITGVNVNTVNGKKAFKYIKSVSRSATITGNINVGTLDIFGFPLRTDSFNYVTVNWNNAVITASTGYLAADTTTATATTGDVRGTYAVQSASDGTKRLIISQLISAALLATAGDTGLFGVTQFSG